jgi:hypothetical protein
MGFWGRDEREWEILEVELRGDRRFWCWNWEMGIGSSRFSSNIIADGGDLRVWIR